LFIFKIEVVRDYIEYAAAGIANLVTLFRPQMVIIGDAISAKGDYLLEPLRKSAGGRICAAGILPMPPRLGNDAGVIGAALLGMAPAVAGGGKSAAETGGPL
jgi:glucokinase